jgi:MFS family permease
MPSPDPISNESAISPTTDLPSDIEKGSNDSTQEEKPFERNIPPWRWFLVCLGLYLGALLYGLDTTISASVQGPILSSLGEIEKLAWVGIGFPMGSVSVILLLGWCFALFEIKHLMIGSIIAFEAGSALCGAAPTMNAMIFGRIIAGIGGAGMYLGCVFSFLLQFMHPFSHPLHQKKILLTYQ